MSINLSIKDVPDEVADRLRARAVRNHRSLQGELMAIVEQAAESQEAAAKATLTRLDRGLQRGTKSIEQVAEDARRRFPKGTPSSVDFIRAMRDSRHGDAAPR